MLFMVIVALLVGLFGSDFVYDAGKAEAMRAALDDADKCRQAHFYDIAVRIMEQPKTVPSKYKDDCVNPLAVPGS
jgi:hypothetical protein